MRVDRKGFVDESLRRVCFLVHNPEVHEEGVMDLVFVSRQNIRQLTNEIEFHYTYSDGDVEAQNNDCCFEDLVTRDKRDAVT